MQVVSGKAKLKPKSPQSDVVLYDASPLGKVKYPELRRMLLWVIFPTTATSMLKF